MEPFSLALIQIISILYKKIVIMADKLSDDNCKILFLLMFVDSISYFDD